MSGPLLRADAASLQRGYREADPFPHAVLDGLFPEDRLSEVLEAFPPPDSGEWRRFARANEKKLAREDVFAMPAPLRDFLLELNSPAMLRFVEDLTGIDGLIPDPYYWGGGLHQIVPGGYLKVHADFNWHSQLRLHRRVNLLLFLNRDWDEAYGGHLELWDRDLREARRRILPVFNRTVVFDTTDHAFHGHPHPLRCPPGRSRKSLAIYYYSRERPEAERSGAHTTLFRRIPGERPSLRLDGAVSRLAMDWLPPAVYDYLKRRRRRRG